MGKYLKEAKKLIKKRMKEGKSMPDEMALILKAVGLYQDEHNGQAMPHDKELMRVYMSKILFREKSIQH